MPALSEVPSFPDVAGVRFGLIPGWPGYAAADDGSIWTAKLTGGHGRFGPAWNRMSPSKIKRGGYLTVQLSQPGSNRTLRQSVHKLVMLAFVGPRPDGQQVRHLDGNPENCRLDNLAYGTPIENGADAVAHGRHYRGNKGKLSAEKVKDVKRRLANGETQASIASDLGVGPMTISDINTGRTWSHVT